MSQTIEKEMKAPKLDLLLGTLPKLQLLKSFNIFEITRPQHLLREYTKKCTVLDIPDRYISATDDSQSFYGEYKEHDYSRSVKKELSVSAGIEGKYGPFSASLQVDYSKTDHSTETSFFSSYVARMDMGNVDYGGSNETTLSLLDPIMLTELRAINSLEKAKNFTENWGTHLITRLNCGGMLFVSIAAETTNKEEKEKLKASLNAKYSSANSLSAAATVISESSQTQASKSFEQKLVAMGGHAGKAALIDGKDKKSIQDWIDTCTVETAFRVSGSIEIYKLAEGDAYRFLKQYIDLVMLAHSIKNPVIFVNEKNIIAYQTNTVTAPGTNTDNYKIIGGGATTSPGSSSYLMGCYPQVSGGRPTGWHAVSHDIHDAASPKDVLSAYAIGIYDPEDLIQITVATKNGSNTRVGGDTATAILPDGWILTSGGLNTVVKTGSSKYVISSYYSEDKKGWIGDASDYVVPATEAALTVYAVGIKSKDALLTIEATYVAGPQTRGQHGRNTANAQTAICGGGIRVSDNSGMGNLVQRNYPASPTSWMGTNDDLAGNISPANSQAYGVTLNAKVKF